jgi:hypothetical protein
MKRTGQGFSAQIVSKIIETIDHRRLILNVNYRFNKNYLNLLAKTLLKFKKVETQNRKR